MGRVVFLSLVIFAFLYITSPLIFPIAMGGVLAILLTPWHRRLERRGMPSALGSGILTGGITVILILPMSFLISLAAKTGIQQLELWKKTPHVGKDLLSTFVRTPKVNRALIWVMDRAPLSMNELVAKLQEFSVAMGIYLKEFLGGVLAHLPGTLIGLLVVVISVYFFLLEGRKWLRLVRTYSIFTPAETDRILKVLFDTCRSVILAALVAGGIQGFLEWLACMITGHPHAGLIGLLVFIGSFIPVVGAAPITLFVALQAFIGGSDGEGILLLVMVFLLVGIDNAVRPWFLKGSANLHPFLAFIGAIGGLQTLGFIGIFLGPVLASLFAATLQIFLERRASASSAK